MRLRANSKQLDVTFGDVTIAPPTETELGIHFTRGPRFQPLHVVWTIAILCLAVSRTVFRHLVSSECGSAAHNWHHQPMSSHQTECWENSTGYQFDRAYRVQLSRVRLQV